MKETTLSSVLMAKVHISEADAARDFAAVLAWVRAGAEVIIENGRTRWP
jgi:hypothetical protein